VRDCGAIHELRTCQVCDQADIAIARREGSMGNVRGDGIEFTSDRRQHARIDRDPVRR